MNTYQIKIKKRKRWHKVNAFITACDKKTAVALAASKFKGYWVGLSGPIKLDYEELETLGKSIKPNKNENRKSKTVRSNKASR